MNQRSKIPATIVTGFLGAGKTTLVRHLLQTTSGRRIALIVNEFGDMGFDGSLLSECGASGCAIDDVVELTNGCICCTVADDFLPAMETILARDPAPDHIIVETSGLALPQPLVRAFNWPGVRERVTVDGVVTVVDSAAVAAGQVTLDEERVAAQRAADEALDHESPIEELFEDQLRCADLIVLAKADLLGAADMARVERRVAEDAREGVSRVKSHGGNLPAEILLGLGSAAEDDLAARAAHHEHDHDHDDEDGHHHHEHDHDEFDSFVLRPAPVGSLEEARELVARVMAMEGVLRVKGRLHVAGKPALAVVQAVGPRVEAWFQADEVGGSGLVIIGLKQIDRARIADVLSAEVAA